MPYLGCLLDLHHAQSPYASLYTPIFKSRRTQSVIMTASNPIGQSPCTFFHHYHSIDYSRSWGRCFFWHKRSRHCWIKTLLHFDLKLISDVQCAHYWMQWIRLFLSLSKWCAKSSLQDIQLFPLGLLNADDQIRMRKLPYINFDVLTFERRYCANY